MRRYDVGNPDHVADRLQLVGLVGEIAEDAVGDGVRAGIADQDGMSVALLARDLSGADGAAGAGPVLDDRGLAPPRVGGGRMGRRVWVVRQSAAWPRRGKAAVAENPAAADSTRRRESLVVTFHSLLRLLFCGEPRKCAGGRQADGLAQAL